MNIIDFEKEARLRREKNQYALKYSINNLELDKDLKEKVDRYAERYNLPKNYVYDRLKSTQDDMVFNWFEKDPAKQNIYEMLQLEFVQKIEKETRLINWVKKLPASWKNAKYIREWKIVYIPNNKKEDLKSLDFYRNYKFQWNIVEFYTTCKYTKDEWGAQDNQSNDVITTFKEALKITNNDLFFIALIDGKYYHENHEKRNNLDFLKYLNSFWYNNKRCIAVDCDWLFEIIKQEIIKWLNSLKIDNNTINQEIERISSLELVD